MKVVIVGGNHGRLFATILALGLAVESGVVIGQPVELAPVTVHGVSEIQIPVSVNDRPGPDVTVHPARPGWSRVPSLEVDQPRIRTPPPPATGQAWTAIQTPHRLDPIEQALIGFVSVMTIASLAFASWCWFA